MVLILMAKLITGVLLLSSNGMIQTQSRLILESVLAFLPVLRATPDHAAVTIGSPSPPGQS